MTTCYVDAETTGLDPARHDAWEIAVIVEGHRDPARDGEWVWQVHPDLTTADPEALRVGRYYERRVYLRERGRAVLRNADGGFTDATDSGVAEVTAELLADAHFVASNPAFDAAFIAKFLRANGQAPAWRYHLIDVRPLALGYLAGAVDAGTARAHAAGRTSFLWESLGLNLRNYELHTALGDARLARDVYRAVLGGGE